MYLLGLDIGSSSIKASLVEASTGKTVSKAQHPDVEMDMISVQEGWAEQDPEKWWKSVVKAIQKVIQSSEVSPDDIKSIGIAYQMHGLVLVDKDHKVLRPSIIWCDSRAVEIGKSASLNIGKEKCLSHLLNSPGNFTASKLKWVKDNEPQIYSRIHKMMLPGDYIAMKLCGEIKTTVSGLSEGILWDFKEEKIANLVLDYYELDKSFIPELVDCFSKQGQVTDQAAELTGLKSGTIISYRSGDQPNNALSLGVFRPNEVAATGGTSGVVYGVVDQAKYDKQSRVNGFAHVNHRPEDPRIGLLLCINGAGIQYAWTRKQMASAGSSYNELEKIASEIPIGSDGLRIIPFGNGAERILGNLTTGAQVNNLHFARHSKAHMYRASLEGIAFSFVYGFEVLRELGLEPKVIKVGNDNLFQSNVFSSTVSNLLNCNIEIINTNGASGAARASGIATGVYRNLEEAFHRLSQERLIHPDNSKGNYKEAYGIWEDDLKHLIEHKKESTKF